MATQKPRLRYKAASEGGNNSIFPGAETSEQICPQTEVLTQELPQRLAQFGLNLAHHLREADHEEAFACSEAHHSPEGEVMAM